jgi:LAO/AO transport system kinase
MPADELIDAALAGDRRALARLLSRVEAGGAEADEIVQALYPRSGGRHVIGVTGAPGTGKSTLAGRLARALRERGQRVAVVAVDPSSPFTGGALLGDRVRMNDLAGDPDVFVRSMASRGAGGGLADQAAAACVVLAATGFGAIILETVGAGQDELAIAQEAQTTIVVTAPGLGDDVQALKAGILEIADVLVVNKADREGADRLVADLSFGRALGSGQHRPTQSEVRSPKSEVGLDIRLQTPDFGLPWTVPVLKTVATTGKGVEDLARAIEQHRAWLRESGAGEARARASAGRQILRHAAAVTLREAERRACAGGDWDRLVAGVATRRCSPAQAARRLLERPAQPPQRGAAGECA